MLLRHARAEDFRPGFPHHARRLTAAGERQAVELGERMRAERVGVDLVLCSPATRALQTAEALGLPVPIETSDVLVDAGGDEILALVRGLPDDVAHVLLVGHAPTLPAVVHELADPQASDVDALAAIEWRFPPGTLATLRVTGSWSSLDQAALVAVRLPAEG